MAIKKNFTKMFWRVRKPAYEPVQGIYAENIYPHVHTYVHKAPHWALYGTICVIEEY